MPQKKTKSVFGFFTPTKSNKVQNVQFGLEKVKLATLIWIGTNFFIKKFGMMF